MSDSSAPVNCAVSPRPADEGNSRGLIYGPRVRKRARVIHDAIRPDETRDYFSRRAGEGRDELMSREKDERYIRESRVRISSYRIACHVWKRAAFLEKGGRMTATFNGREENAQTRLLSSAEVEVFARRAIRFRVSDWQLWRRYCVPGEIDCGSRGEREKENVCRGRRERRAIDRSRYIAIIRRCESIYKQLDKIHVFAIK